MTTGTDWLRKLVSFLRQWHSFGIFLVFIVLLAGWVFLPVSDWVDDLLGWIDDFGLFGPPIFILIYILAVILLVPGSALTIAAGIAYGNWGIPVALFAATAGACAAFLIARYLAYEKVHTLIGRKRTLLAVEDVVNNEGWKIIILVRVSPLIPFNVQNYFFGITEVPLMQYAVSTFVGLIPGTIVSVVIGKLANGGFDGGIVQWGFLGFGAIASCFLIWHVTRKVKKKLAKKSEN